ncbi:hypothetical protein EN784_04610 [bacterium M00.F.Ca.ET.141.01.1.1]|nr:hypothetical protein EN784_04610 [bacterium M00.F.Ca.ET.141.01.1.1]
MPETKPAKARGVLIENVSIEGCNVGIKVSGADLTAKNIDFRNVRQAFDVSDSRAQISSTRITHGPDASKGENSGWRKSNGPPLPVFCSNCKSVFASRHYNFGGTYFNLWDNEEPCIKCGNEHAALSEGVFDLAREVVRVLSAPDMTHVMLQCLNSIAADMISGRIAAGSAIEKIAAVSPSLGEVAKKALAVSGTVAAWIVGTGIALFSAYYGVKAVNLSETQLAIAQEQLELQKQDSGQQDAVLKQILQHLPRGEPDLKVHRDDDAKAGEDAAAEPTKGKAAGKGDRLKARDLRRKVEVRRRNEFGRARHR